MVLHFSVYILSMEQRSGFYHSSPLSKYTEWNLWDKEGLVVLVQPYNSPHSCKVAGRFGRKV